MKNKMSIGLALIISVVVTGCPEPSRESRRDTAADARCGRLEECGRLGSGGTYTDFDDCVVEVRSDFNDFWPASECSDGRMNEELYEECLQDLRTSDCNQNTFDNFINTLGFGIECGANNVCVDPPD